jgi:hypothetical protein
VSVYERRFRPQSTERSHLEWVGLWLITEPETSDGAVRINLLFTCRQSSMSVIVQINVAPVMFLDSVGGIYRVSPSHISLIGFRIPPRGLASEMWTSIGWVVSYVVGFSYGSGRGSYRDLGFHIYDLGWWSGAKIAGDNKLFHQM